MAIDPEVQNKLDEITSKIDALRKASKTGEVVLPLGMLGLNDQQHDEVRTAVELAAREKLQQFGVSLPQVAGTWGYSR